MFDLQVHKHGDLLITEIGEDVPSEDAADEIIDAIREASQQVTPNGIVSLTITIERFD